jgi:hypothetical protein
MDLKKRGENALNEAEAALRELAAEAAQEGQYDELGVLADVAQRVGDLARSLARVPSVDSDDVPQRQTPRRRKRGSTSQYPRFSRAGNLLVKTSWSKKKRDEYEHKAPHNAFLWMTQALTAADAVRRPVPMDDLLPVLADDGQEIPSYQAYLALSFLREQGIVTQVGRSGYKLAMPGPEAEAAARKAWEALEVYG